MHPCLCFACVFVLLFCCCVCLKYTDQMYQTQSFLMYKLCMLLLVLFMTDLTMLTSLQVELDAHHQVLLLDLLCAHSVCQCVLGVSAMLGFSFESLNLRFNDCGLLRFQIRPTSYRDCRALQLLM